MVLKKDKRRKGEERKYQRKTKEIQKHLGGRTIVRGLSPFLGCLGI